MKKILESTKDYLLMVSAFLLLLIYNPWAYNLIKQTAIWGLSLSLGAMMVFIPVRFRRLVFILLALPICLAYLIIFENQILLGIPLSYEIAISILSSNWQESREFISHFSGFKMYATAVYAFLPLLLVFLIDKKNKISIKKYFYIFIVVFFTVDISIAAFVVFNLEKNDLYKALVNIVNVNGKKNEILFNNIEDIVDLDRKSGSKTYVVLISDSIGTEYMSLYGFNVKNTPFLDRMKSNIYAFDNVTTKYNFTYEVLERFLTFSEDVNDQKSIKEKGTLINFYKNAGFKVYWISAHPQYGFTNSFSYLTAGTDVTYFRRASNEDLTDAIVLPEVENALNDQEKKKVIFVHMQGAHYEYNTKYPKGYGENNVGLKKLENDSEINPKYINYLRAIMYQDEILKKIFEMVKAKKDSSSFILFLSDHAEDVDPKGNASFSHGGIIKPEVMEVPFVLWLSDVYKKNNSGVVWAVEKNLHRPYETNLLHNGILDLSRLSHSYIDETKSLFNKKFIERHRFYDDLEIKNKTL